jgi:formate dehydrogenase subunit gamma
MNTEIERYTFRERVCHWLTGFSYLYCLCTGLAFYSPHLYWMAFVLGGGPTSRYWHPIIGLGFFAFAMWMHHLWRRDMSLSDADRQWLKEVENYVENRDERVVPQDRFNAGQKLFYWAMFYGAALLLISGLVMWVPEYVPVSIRWLLPAVILLHECAALITIGAFIIHIYMGVFMVPGGLHAMLFGYVSREWARAHHRLWYQRVAGEAPPEK